MKVTYSHNNSGGTWWLSDDDWKKLEAAGWKVDWIANQPRRNTFADKDGRFLGALATSASIEASSVKVAKAMWEDTLSMDADDTDCPCCGAPHPPNFMTEKENSSIHKPLPERVSEMAKIKVGNVTLLDYYLAPTTPLEEANFLSVAYNWHDKPHRLIYDLVQHILDTK